MRDRPGCHRQQLKVWRDISAARGFPLRSVGFKFQVELPSLKHQSWKGTQIMSSDEKQQGLCLPGRDGWRQRVPLHGPTHKISFAAIYPGLWQREGSVD